MKTDPNVPQGFSPGLSVSNAKKETTVYKDFRTWTHFLVLGVFNDEVPQPTKPSLKP